MPPSGSSGSSSASQTSPPTKPTRMSHALIGFGVCILIGLGITWGYDRVAEKLLGLSDRLDTFKSETNQKMAELPKSTEELRAIIREMEKKFDGTKESFELLQREVDRQGGADAIALADTAQLYFRGEKIRKRLEVLTDEFGQWTTRPDLLLSSDDGKRIAAVPDLVSRFMMIGDKPCDTETDLASYAEELERILTPVARAYQNENAGFHIDQTWADRLDGLEKKIDEALNCMDEQRIAISSILKQAPEQIPDGTPTLKEAIVTEKERLEEEKVALVMESMREERVKNAKMIADAMAAGERVRAEAEAKAARLLGATKAGEITEAVAKHQAELARKQLEAEFQRDEGLIQSYLGVLTLPGYVQPGRGGDYITTVQKGPVSLSALRAAGVLSKDIYGLAAFTVVVERLKRPSKGWPRLKVYNDRLTQTGLGNVPVGPDQEFVQRAQDLLIKYGELMVGKKMLAP